MQLSGNQIIPRTEKPINKGAMKTNRTMGAAGKCCTNTDLDAGARLEMTGLWAVVGVGVQSEGALLRGIPLGTAQPKGLPNSLRRCGLCPGG